MMNLLAVETASHWCSVALWRAGEVVTRDDHIPQQHAERVLGQVDEVLAEAGIGARDLTHLAFGRGPGSFTGVRIAASVVQGLGYSLGCPIAPISSLLAMAEGMRRTGGHTAVVPAFDARRDEVYVAAYRYLDGVWRAVLDDCVIPPARLTALGGSNADWIGVGGGWESYRETMTDALGVAIAAIDHTRCPRAFDVAQLAANGPPNAFVTPAQALPVYLRDDVVIER
ncbi:MAG: tRNA (adenosine(37)-N6)-threonylcarbamoyltransferase complex dimerization subunit type 1 TsaB [Pseudomonadota bacterium]